MCIHKIQYFFPINENLSVSSYSSCAYCAHNPLCLSGPNDVYCSFSFAAMLKAAWIVEPLL